MSAVAGGSLLLDHVGIDVHDLDASIAFYCRALDLEKTYEFDLEELGIRGVFLANAAGWTIELFKREGATPHGRPPDPNVAHDMLGIGHFCLRTGDIRAAFDQLLAAGATSRLDPMQSPHPEFDVAYVSDPEGNLIELIAQSTQAG